MGELITKVLISAFAAIYTFVVARSIYRGEILFIQGRGVMRENSPGRFFRFFIYHALIAGVFVTIAICSWLFL